MTEWQEGAEVKAFITYELIAAAGEMAADITEKLGKLQKRIAQLQKLLSSG